MYKVLVCGGGGFIGGHLTKSLMKNNSLVCADIKPMELWFQQSEKNKNFQLDLKEYENCLEATKDVDHVYNLACNMGGMGFIENNKAECMLSVLVNTNLLRACLKNKVKRYYYSSSACVYNGTKQTKTFIPGLKESDAYPADPEDGYGWEKLFSERMCRHFNEDFGMDVRVVRYHNVYGPYGTFGGGREKAPAALCRKIIEAKLSNKKEIDVWGDGEQSRSFLYIDDCVEGTETVFNKSYKDPLNIGSDEQVSINQMIAMIEEIADYKVKKNYQLDKPLGVRGRSSDNTLAIEKIGWKPSYTLKQGLEKTYKWIYEQMTTEKSNSQKFTQTLDKSG